MVRRRKDPNLPTAYEISRKNYVHPPLLRSSKKSAEKGQREAATALPTPTLENPVPTAASLRFTNGATLAIINVTQAK